MVRLLPRRGERPLTDLLAELAQVLVDTADLFSKVLGHGPRERARIAPRIHDQATRATELCERLSNRLADSLITPYEAELLYDLALSIADGVDAMEHAAELVVLSRIGTVPTPLLEAAKSIERAGELTVQAAWSLRRVSELEEYYPQIRRIKHLGDRLCRQALADLLRRGGTAAELLPTHDVITATGQIFTHLEHVARLADLLRVKDT